MGVNTHAHHTFQYMLKKNPLPIKMKTTRNSKANSFSRLSTCKKVSKYVLGHIRQKEKNSGEVKQGPCRE